MDRAVVLLLSGVSATFHLPFILHAFPVIFLSLSFDLDSFPFLFLSYSSNVHSGPVINLSFEYMCMQFRCILYSCPFISFSKLLENALWPSQGTECNKMIITKVIAK